MNKTLEWVIKHELPTGGLEAWNGYGSAYPEVTGYIIPTLIKHGKDDIAQRFADYLESVQNKDGSFDGIDGKKRTFDTAACAEGLKAAGREQAAEKAVNWLWSMRMESGFLKITPDSSDTRVYTMRAGWIMDDKKQAALWRSSLRWSSLWQPKERPHYIAYALEGLWNMGYVKEVTAALQASESMIVHNNFIPFYATRPFISGEGTDTTATIQFAVLYAKAGMLTLANKLKKGALQALQKDGGLWHDLSDTRCISWAAKYWLDMEAL